MECAPCLRYLLGENLGFIIIFFSFQLILFNDTDDDGKFDPTEAHFKVPMSEFDWAVAQKYSDGVVLVTTTFKGKPLKNDTRISFKVILLFFFIFAQ